MKIALVGNPNSGKTSLFNLMTGAHQRTANLPGVTVEVRRGELRRGNVQADVLDLPGLYSLDALTPEQRLAAQTIETESPDCIINVVDATSLSRSLYLTLQLRALKRPVVVLLNMMDEAEQQGIEIDEEKLGQLLGMVVIKGSVFHRRGMDRLLSTALATSACPPTSPCPACHGCKGCSEAMMLYTEIEGILRQSVTLSKPPTQKDEASVQNPKNLTQKIDSVLLHRVVGVPLFLLIMFGIFSLTFSGPVKALSGLLGSFLTQTVASSLADFFAAIHAPIFFKALLCDGVLPAVASVVSFLPQITLLFLLLSLLEDCGYMTRAAFVADRFLSFTGLSGSSFIPMAMGFGCSVPALMACRTLPSRREHILTLMVTPFITCGARFPIIALFAGTFFKQNSSLFVMGMYLLSVVVALASATLLNKAMFRKQSPSFIMEMPPYRLPVPRNLLLHTWDRAKGFLIKAGTTIFAAAVIIWLLSHYTFQFTATQNMQTSMMAGISSVIAPIFAPLGFGTWQASASLMIGVGAKEMIVSTLALLYPISQGGLPAAFTTGTAIQFVVFSILYLPCLSSIITLSREMRSAKYTILSLLFSFSVAYLVTLAVGILL